MCWVRAWLEHDVGTVAGVEEAIARHKLAPPRGGESLSGGFESIGRGSYVVIILRMAFSFKNKSLFYTKRRIPLSESKILHKMEPSLTHPFTLSPSLLSRLDFGSKPIERQLILSAQFLHNELPVRLAHRVAELEKAPYGLSAKPYVLKVRDWYVESFKELRSFPRVRDSADEEAFTSMLRKIYHRHRNVVPVMAMGVAGKCVG